MDIQLKKGNLDLCVLHILSLKDSYGYEIAFKVSKHISIGEITIYPILRKLQDDGCLDHYLKESVDGPPRKYYKITNKGRLKYQMLKEEWQRFNDAMRDFFKENV